MQFDLIKDTEPHNLRIRIPHPLGLLWLLKYFIYRGTYIQVRSYNFSGSGRSTENSRVGVDTLETGSDLILVSGLAIEVFFLNFL